MEFELTPGIIISLVSVTVALVSFFNSRNKDQSKLDKEQDERISAQDVELASIQGKQAAIDQRLTRLESVQETLELKLTKEVEKVYDRVGKMEISIREDIRELTKAIINKES